MKLFVVATVATVAVAEKKVPPRHPLQRLNKLNKFANEWVGDNLSDKQAANWGPKFDRNSARMEKRFELCGFYDDSSEHGGPRERRTADDDSELTRYDQSNPIRGIQQITKGFSKWAQRYIADCGLQPARQVDRMNKWFGQLTGKLAENNAEPEEEEDNSEDNGYDNDSNNDDSNNDNSNGDESNDEGY
jgi:hypothetical protein